MLIDVQREGQEKEHLLPHPSPGGHTVVPPTGRRRESPVDLQTQAFAKLLIIRCLSTCSAVIDMAGFHGGPIAAIPAGHSVVLGGVVCLGIIGEQFIHDEAVDFGRYDTSRWSTFSELCPSFC